MTHPKVTQPCWVNECERRPTTNSVFHLLVVGVDRNGSRDMGYAKGRFNDGQWKFTSEDPQMTRVVAWLEGAVASDHEVHNLPKDNLRF
jgi:hypothetical protein